MPTRVHDGNFKPVRCNVRYNINHACCLRCGLYADCRNLLFLPREQVRVHVCWGNYAGPHHHDVPLQDVIDIVLTCKPKFISIEACNPGHAHEWEVFETVVWPDNKVVILGWDISVRAMLAPVYRYTITGTSVYRQYYR